METLQALFTRKSVRKFQDKPVPDDVIHTILRAGMSGPTTCNKRMWSFVVVRDKETLQKMAKVNGRFAAPLLGADFAVLVCGDMKRTLRAAPEFWVIDGSIAAQNMLLAAHEQGVGGVWLGTWPSKERVDGQAALFDLPKTAVPHSILAFGWPAEGESFPERDLYEADRVHFEKW